MAAIDKQSMKAPKFDVAGNAEKSDAYVDVNVKSDQHSTKASVVAVELKDRDADAPVKVNVVNIPLVSYDPKKSKTPISKSSSFQLRDLGIEKSIFIKPKTFHLTILMLKLWNEERVNAAAEVLQSVSSQVMDALDNRPVSIKLKGLDCMKGSLAKARVLYTPVEEVGGEDRLLRASQVITDAFAEAGLLVGTDAQQKLKLHPTLMNARHRKRNKNGRNLDSFDARGIFDRYGSEEWGEYPIREVHLKGLCSMRTDTTTAVPQFHFLPICKQSDSFTKISWGDCPFLICQWSGPADTCQAKHEFFTKHRAAVVERPKDG